MRILSKRTRVKRGAHFLQLCFWGCPRMAIDFYRTFPPTLKGLPSYPVGWHFHGPWWTSRALCGLRVSGPTFGWHGFQKMISFQSA